MAVTVTRFDTGSNLEHNEDGVASSASLVFTVRGTDDEATATASARTSAQALETNGLYLGMSYYATSCERLALDTMRVTVKYRRNNASISTSSTSEFQSREWSTVSLQKTVKRLVSVRDSYHSTAYPAPAGINEDLEGEVHGAEVEFKALRIVERWTFRSSKWTSTYKGHVLSLIQHVNNASFRGYSAGEVLFSDFSATERSDGLVDLVFTFDISENGTVSPGTTDAGTSPSLTKKGWDLEWHTTARNSSGASVVIWAETGPVYPEGNFSNLSI